MGGGAWEYVAAYVNSEEVQNGGYSYNYASSLIDSVNVGNIKYADMYKKGNENTSTNNFQESDPSTSAGHYGDAVWETSTLTDIWYDNYISFPYTIASFFVRGGSKETKAGMFSFGCYYGYGDPKTWGDYTFRVVVPVL